MEFKSARNYLRKWWIQILLTFAFILFLVLYFTPHSFTHLIQGPFILLETRDSSNGKYYKTENETLIVEYQRAMEYMRFRKKILPVPAYTGGSSISITDVKGVTHTVGTGPGNTYSIDGVWYKVSRSGGFETAWKNFSSQFYTDVNYMPQK
jgi:hypothetical protein